MQTCNTCDYRKNGICTNKNSDRFGEMVPAEYFCEEWEKNQRGETN